MGVGGAEQLPPQGPAVPALPPGLAESGTLRHSQGLFSAACLPGPPVCPEVWPRASLLGPMPLLARGVGEELCSQQPRWEEWHTQGWGAGRDGGTCPLSSLSQPCLGFTVWPDGAPLLTPLLEAEPGSRNLWALKPKPTHSHLQFQPGQSHRWACAWPGPPPEAIPAAGGSWERELPTPGCPGPAPGPLALSPWLQPKASEPVLGPRDRRESCTPTPCSKRAQGGQSELGGGPPSGGGGAAQRL